MFVPLELNYKPEQTLGQRFADVSNPFCLVILSVSIFPYVPWETHMTQRSELLEHERRKLVLLRKKVAEQERRVRLLEAIKDDPFDLLLEQELAASEFLRPSGDEEPPKVEQEGYEPVQDELDVATVQASAPSPMPFVMRWGEQPRNPRKVPQQWVALFKFIGREGKTFEDLKQFIRDRNFSLTDGAARTALMNYRKENGFIENPRKGFYRATERALAFIEQQETGDPARQGGVSETQPIPLTRAAA